MIGFILIVMGGTAVCAVITIMYNMCRKNEMSSILDALFDAWCRLLKSDGLKKAILIMIAASVTVFEIIITACEYWTTARFITMLARYSVRDHTAHRRFLLIALNFLSYMREEITDTLIDHAVIYIEEVRELEGRV